MSKRLGQPTKFKPDLIRQIKVLAGFDFTWQEIARVLNVRKETLSRWKHKHPEMDEVYAQGREELKAMIVSGFIKELKAGNWDAIKEGMRKKLGWKDTPLVDQSQHTHFIVVRPDKQETKSTEKEDKLSFDERVQINCQAG